MYRTVRVKYNRGDTSYDHQELVQHNTNTWSRVCVCLVDNYWARTVEVSVDCCKVDRLKLEIIMIESERGR